MDGVLLVDMMIPELIHKIFQNFSTPLHLHDLNSFPWYLGHVCALWRAVFMTMHLQFWNKLDIKLDFIDNLCDYPFKKISRYELMRYVLKFFLNRTNRPFSFQLRPQYALGEEDYVSPMLEMLVAESTRWEDVSISWDQRSHVPILYRARNRLPLLRSLQLFKPSLTFKFNDELPLGHDLLEGASCLRNVRIADLCEWRVDWTQLRVLKIGQFHQGERLLSVLSQAKQLEKLAIYQALYDTGFNLDLSTKLLSFESLKVLTVMDVGLLSIFYAPCLEELYIDGWNDEDSTVHNVITSLQCSLARPAASNALA
ncbi:hypothetical protein M378DRAFT_18293 [Amanita muscaria Koide BX008]|uniref:F-box domain-containing protein n=1 Tax=Amanita muscaria (strain Koide BX008) TaxID=946122 RepID=A0A0C2SM82_AMAMK|nr:hypothetical protein M378DRAFT_18293 [Amanita muscaria Koide BX008]